MEVKQETEELVKGMKEKWDDIAGELNIIMRVVQAENHFGRNNMCFCGSMKKFKKCHLPEHEEKEARITYLIDDLKTIGDDIREAKRELKKEQDNENQTKERIPSKVK